MSAFLKPSLNWLLIFFPAFLFLEHMYPESHSLIFLSSCAAIILLAGVLGKYAHNAWHGLREGFVEDRVTLRGVAIA